MNRDDSMISAEPSSLPNNPQDAAVGRPWGFWITSGFALIVIAVFIVVHGIIGTPFRASIMASNPGIEQSEVARLLQNNGLFISVSTLVSGILCTAVIVFFAWIRRGIKVREYLALGRPATGVIRSWLIAVACFVAASESLKFLLGYELVPEFLTNVYTTSVYPPLLWIAAIVVAPVFEEFLFRGFLFAGWSQSKLGATGAILLTSLLWATTHTQYEFYYVALVFAFGVFAGVARHRTRSLAVPILIHSVVNLIATIETVIVLRN